VTDIYWYNALPLAVFGSASSTSVNLLDLLTNVYDAGARRVKFSRLAPRGSRAGTGRHPTGMGQNDRRALVRIRQPFPVRLVGTFHEQRDT
jgi:hypothetical protein